MAVVGQDFVVFFHKAGGEDTAGAVGAALQLEAQIKEVPHDLKTAPQQQVDHHRHVVAQEDLAVVQLAVMNGAFQCCHSTSQLAAHVDQGLLEQLFGLAHHLRFAGVGAGRVFRL